jgi:phage terminase large subunit
VARRQGTAQTRPEVELEFANLKQADFTLDFDSPAIVYSGAYRGAKTTALVLKGWVSALTWPGRRATYTRKTFASMPQTTMTTYRNFTPTEYIVDRNKSEHTFTWFNGSMDYFVGCDMDERIKSLQSDIILVDQAEELTEESWFTLEGRLNVEAMPKGQIAAACNPSRRGKNHWLYQLGVVKKMARWIHTTTLENRFLPDDYIQNRVSRFTGKLRRLYIEGEWESFEGMVYDIYNPTIHVLEPKPIPKEWPRYSAWDFGFTNPACVLYGAVDSKGEWGVENAVYVYRELYETKRLVADMGKEALMLAAGESIYSTWSDHDAQERAILQQVGVGTVAAIKDVRDGIDLVYSLLNPAHGPNGDQPALYFMADMLVRKDRGLEMDQLPTSTLDEFAGYVYEEPKEGKASKEDPRKFQDHGMDALRYLCMGIARTSRVPSVIIGPEPPPTPAPWWGKEKRE